jgi:putative ABC transport system substrate-binding protein
LFPGWSWCYDLLIVESQRSPAYDEVLRGLRSVASFSERVIVLSDYNEIDLIRVAREEHPAVIVTLGDKALAAARKLRQTPMVALMALSYKSGAPGHPALTGVEVQSPPERYLPLFNSIGSSRVGIISINSRSGGYVRQARKAAAEAGIELVVREVKSSREVAGQLATLAGTVDAIWMLPDSVTSSGEAADAHFLFAASNRIPVVTFSSAYLTSGAALALDFDRFEMGRQGGEMALSLVNGARITEVPPQPPRKTSVTTNPAVLRKLEIKPDPGGRGAE